MTVADALEQNTVEFLLAKSGGWGSGRGGGWLSGRGGRWASSSGGGWASSRGGSGGSGGLLHASQSWAADRISSSNSELSLWALLLQLGAANLPCASTGNSAREWELLGNSGAFGCLDAANRAVAAVFSNLLSLSAESEFGMLVVATNALAMSTVLFAVFGGLASASAWWSGRCGGGCCGGG